MKNEFLLDLSQSNVCQIKGNINDVYIDGDRVFKKYKTTNHSKDNKAYVLLARDSGGDVRCYHIHLGPYNVWNDYGAYLGKFPERTKITKENVLKFCNC